MVYSFSTKQNITGLVMTRKKAKRLLGGTQTKKPDITHPSDGSSPDQTHKKDFYLSSSARLRTQVHKSWTLPYTILNLLSWIIQR